MKKTLAPLALVLAAALASPAFAEAEVPQKIQFTHEGVTYTYTKTKVGESTIYKGNAVPGDTFYLVARKGMVNGKANGATVSYRAPVVDIQAASAKQIPLATR